MAEEGKQEPGEATRQVIALSGVNEHAAKTRRWLILGCSLAGVLVLAVLLDLAGVIEIPGIGLRQRVGLAPQASDDTDGAGPHVPTTSAAERERMRRKLMGGGDTPPASTPTPTTSKGRLAAELFADDEKRESAVDLPTEKAPVVATLPDGLTQKQVFEVINENSAAVSVCLGEAMRRGEQAKGRMEVALTIAASGRVSEAEVVTAKYQGSIVGGCITRRARNWKFPPFTGDPVTVIYPYVLDAAL